MKDIFVSVIIPTRNRLHFLKGCLGSLFNQNYPQDAYEVIVVDDSSSDGTLDWLKTIRLNNFKYFSFDFRRGPAAARNLGIKQAQGGIIGFTDDDCLVDKDWIKNAVEYFADITISGIEGKILQDTRDFRLGTQTVANLKGGQFKTGNVFYRKDNLEKMGGFDERFFSPRFKIAFREESDLAFRLLAQGKKIIFAEEVVVTHQPSKKDSIFLAKRYYFDPLLKKKHPRFYNEYIEVASLGRLKIRRLKQKLYLTYALTVVLSLISLIWARHLSSFFMILTISIYLLIWVLQTKIWLVRKFSARELIMHSFALAVVPFAYFIYTLRGYIAFKNK